MRVPYPPKTDSQQPGRCLRVVHRGNLWEATQLGLLQKIDGPSGAVGCGASSVRGAVGPGAARPSPDGHASPPCSAPRTLLGRCTVGLRRPWRPWHIGGGGRRYKFDAWHPGLIPSPGAPAQSCSCGSGCSGGSQGLGTQAAGRAGGCTATNPLAVLTPEFMGAAQAPTRRASANTTRKPRHGAWAQWAAAGTTNQPARRK